MDAYKRGTILPIAVMAFAIVAFILLVDLAISPRPHQPPVINLHYRTACTLEAKVCPDGSTVGRVAPSCTFAACPITTTNTNTTANTNANAAPATNTNQPTQTSNGTVTAQQAMDQAGRYNGQELCIKGAYQNSFEFTAFGSGTSQDNNGYDQVTQPYIWSDVEIPQTSLQCRTTSAGQTVCVGTITACGTFHYAAPGQPGLGHTGAYRYSLS